MPRAKYASVLYNPDYELSRLNVEVGLVMWAGETYYDTKWHDVTRNFYEGVNYLLQSLEFGKYKHTVAILRMDRGGNNRSVALVLFYKKGDVVKVWELPYEPKLAYFFLDSEKYKMRDTRNYLKKWVKKIGYEEGRAKIKASGAKPILMWDFFRPFSNYDVAIQLRNTASIWHSLLDESNRRLQKQILTNEVKK